MYKDALRSVWAEINLSNLEFNLKNIRDKVGADKELIAVIKADAYGCGCIPIAETLRRNGVKTFAVSTLSEVVTLRRAGAKENIIILGITPGLYADKIAEYDVIPAVCTVDNAEAINEAAGRLGKKVRIMIAVDTGMGRIGYRWDEQERAAAEISEIAKLPNIEITCLFSHFATADAADKSYAELQLKRFNEFAAAMKDTGIDIPAKTIANSASVMELPETHFDAVRPGVILYGFYPSDEVDPTQLALKSCMQVKANIVYLKELKKGDTVGYGQKYTAPADGTKIATINLGYADGYPRPYSPVGRVIVDGHYCDLAGNICMDQCMIDVTDVPDVKVGDEVIVMGEDKNGLAVTAEDIANATGTINYEIICAFGQRLPRVYVRNEDDPALDQ
ncbi:MAG: alanine racemase [Eubacteriales bacterium]|nr:alanine racemase [Eubacteriales bacterium]